MSTPLGWPDIFPSLVEFTLLLMPVIMWTILHFIASKPSNVDLNGVGLTEESDLSNVAQGWKYDASGKFVQFKIADGSQILKVDMVL